MEESKSVSSPRNSDRLKAEAEGGRATSTSNASSVRPKIRGRYLHLLDAKAVAILDDGMLECASVFYRCTRLCKIPTETKFGTHDVLMCWFRFFLALAAALAAARYNNTPNSGAEVVAVSHSAHAGEREIDIACFERGCCILKYMYMQCL